MTQTSRKPSKRSQAFKALRRALEVQAPGARADDVKQVALALYDGINTPVSTRLASALRAGRIGEIAEASINHKDYSSPDEFFVDAQAVSFLKKYEGLHELGDGTYPDDREGAAIRGFFDAERQCAATNEKFRLLTGGSLPPDVSDNTIRVIERARAFIKEWLGPAPKLSQLGPKFGPGSTSACTGDSVTLADKLVAFPECTFDALPLTAVIKNSPVWFNLLEQVHPRAFYSVTRITDDFGNQVVVDFVLAPKLVRGNRFTCVTKTAKTHRGICVEPHTNSCLQLALGSILADVITKLGLGKIAQQFVNRRFAQLASLLGNFATIDLSAASDTVAYELVKFLFPADWFNLLARCRSGWTYINKNWVELEKFSSMGNGYTFELETLIFYALAKAAAVDEGDEAQPVCVYGDDIICKSEVFEEVSKILLFCGFTTNQHKSFCGEGFNESCGGDFFRGMAVRPYFLKKEPLHAQAWYGVVNGIRRASNTCMPHGIMDHRFVRAWLRGINQIPKAVRFFGPQTRENIYRGDELLMDNWIHTDDRDRWHFKSNRHSTDVSEQRGLLPVVLRRSLDRYCGSTVYTVALAGVPSSGFALRGEPTRMKACWFSGVL